VKKPYPIWDQNDQSRYPIHDQNDWKTLPFGAAHTYITHIREYSSGVNHYSYWQLTTVEFVLSTPYINYKKELGFWLPGILKTARITKSIEGHRRFYWGTGPMRERKQKESELFLNKLLQTENSSPNISLNGNFFLKDVWIKAIEDVPLELITYPLLPHNSNTQSWFSWSGCFCKLALLSFFARQICSWDPRIAQCTIFEWRSGTTTWRRW